MFDTPITQSSSALSIYLLQLAPDWECLVLAQDFNLLNPGDILAWLDPNTQRSPSAQRLIEKGIQGEDHFEPTLWEACREALGYVPRPGNLRWIQAQDRWRIAFLREALLNAQDPERLGQMVQDIYETMGFPEDMLELWYGNVHPKANRHAVESFVKRLERSLWSHKPLPRAG